MILATAGHIDHGKTALVRALTGIDADRLPEEKQRGLTIDLGFAYKTLPDGTELGFVDVPGHERFLPNMLAGVLSIDRVLLIVAADDGPRPQTMEHLEILELIAVAEITAVVTKADRVDAARLSEVEAKVATLLAEAGHPEAPIFAVSSRTGEGIAALTEHLCDSAARADAARAARPPSGLFRMPIDRAFTLPGIGLVVTGTIAAGSVTAGERLVISPRGAEIRIRGIHSQNRPVERAATGERCALNVVGTFAEGAEPGRGDWVQAAALHKPTSQIDVRLQVSRAAPAPLRDGLPVHLHLGTLDAVARAAVLGARSIEPGGTGFVQLDVEQPIAALWGDRVVLRDHGSRRTLGGGRVADPFPPRRGRGRPERLAKLPALAEPDPGVALAQLVDEAGAVPLAPFALARNLDPNELELIVEAGGLRRLGPPREAVVTSDAMVAKLGDAIVTTLAEWHRVQPDTPGPGRTALFRKLRAAAPEPAIDAALTTLVEAGRVVRDGAALRLREHEARLSREDERLWAQLKPLLEADDLRPPRHLELAAALKIELRPLQLFLKRVERFGRVAAVAPNRVFLPETLARLAAIAHELAAADPEGGFTAAAFKDRSGIGRNLTIEVLEFFDRLGVTRRVGDARTLQPGGDRLFG
ncbi:MAG TPA: selenocysteine-specific translation elongation factor [Stellaceae bacterium]|nr:selenocysteine-specific translation elongation factor [Stellaceae bacterium]